MNQKPLALLVPIASAHAQKTVTGRTASTNNATANGTSPAHAASPGRAQSPSPK